MEIVNCEVAHLRPRYADLKEWMADEDNVYIGRRGIVFVDGERWPKRDSKWANPFRIGPRVTRELSLELYEKHLRSQLERDPCLARDLLQLRGKRLGCWCSPSPCHGNIIDKLARELERREAPDILPKP